MSERREAVVQVIAAHQPDFGRRLSDYTTVIGAAGVIPALLTPCTCWNGVGADLFRWTPEHVADLLGHREDA